MNTPAGMLSADDPLEAELNSGSRSKTVKFRSRDGLREKLEAASEVSGRSISEEAEIRLINSFKLEPIHNTLFNSGANAYQLMNSIATAVDAIVQESRRHGSIFDTEELGNNPANCAAAYIAIRLIIDKCIAFEEPEDISGPFEKMSPQTKEIFRMMKFGELIGKAWTGRASDIVDLMMRQHAADN